MWLLVSSLKTPVNSLATTKKILLHFVSVAYQYVKQHTTKSALMIAKNVVGR